MGYFDWVNALSSCALSSAFEKLKLEVGDDVDARNAQLQGKQAGYKFELIANGGSFSVATIGNRIAGRAVTFALGDAAIEVSDARGKRILDAALTLNDMGECRFLVDGQEKESWQVRKRSLEQLFFVSPL